MNDRKRPAARPAGLLGAALPVMAMCMSLWLMFPMVAKAQDYRKACDLLTQLKEAMADQNKLNLIELLKDMIPQPNASFFDSLPKGATLNEEFNFSECKVDYALMKKGLTADTSAPKITVLFRGIPKGVWAQYWVVENVYDDRGNPIPNRGFQLEASSGNFTDLSKQVRDIGNSDFVGLAPYGRLGRNFLAGREFRNAPYSTKLTFNNVQLLDSTGRLIGYVYVTMGYRGFPDEWYVTEMGPMSHKWLGRDRYVDFLMGKIDSLESAMRGRQPATGPSSRPVLVEANDTTLRQSPGDTTFYASSPTAFDTLYYQVAGEKNAFSVGRSSQFLNMRLYPLDHSAKDTASGPRERGAFALGFSLGGTRTFATLLQAYSTGNVYAPRDTSPYQGRTNLQVGLDARLQILPKVSAGLTVSYQTWAYGYADHRLLSEGSQAATQWIDQEYSETIRTIGFYLYGTYELRAPEDPAAPAAEKEKNAHWVPYGELGVGYGLLVGAQGSLTETVTTGVDVTPQTRSLTYTTSDYRMMPYLTPAAAIGLRLETRRSDFWIALRFRPMTWNVVNYENPEDRNLVPLSQGFFKLDDDIGLNQFALTAGYAFVFKKKQ